MPVESSIWQCGLFRSGSTSGVLKHLKNVHKNSEYELKFAEVEKQRGGEKGSMDKHIVIGSGGLSSFDKKVIHWIACTQASFSDINNPATNALFMDNNPLHKLHDESVYRTKILPIVHLVGLVKCLYKDIPTRWNAAYNMLRRIAEQQEALAHYAILNRKFDFTFDVNESTLLHELTNLLEPMEQLSRLFCCQTSPISVKYPFAKLTVQNLSQMQFENADVIEIRDQIIGGLRMKFFGYSNDRNHQIAMFLDPRFKEKMADFPDLLRRLIRLSTPAVTAKKSRNADFFEPQSSQT
uniref:Transposase n=1 Tax=Globodera rostochiensis TaxID=31243 RepID=A0A914I728_GLORO